MKRKTRLEFSKNCDLMMNLVVDLRFWGGACGNVMQFSAIDEMVPEDEGKDYNSR